MVFINNISDMQTQDLKDYLLTKLKSVQTNEATYLKDLIIENSLLIILMWLLGLSMIGIIINYLNFKEYDKEIQMPRMRIRI